MPDAPPAGPNDSEERLHRCIRDLAALNALPSMCVGRSVEEALDIIVDALPTALNCELVYLVLPGSPGKERASLRGVSMAAAQLAEVRTAAAGDADGANAQLFLSGGTLWCLEAEIPLGNARGRLLAGRSRPLHPDTDRVLVRTAANVVGTTIQTANVLDVARHKDDFLAMLGHELRNPLAPILAASELLARHPAVAREQDVIQRHTQHLARLVDDLLDISRVTRGHIELQNEDVLLSQVLDRATEIVAPLIARHRHTLDVQRVPDVAVRGDAIRLAQIFGNLLNNAAKFTPPGGTIDVRAARSDGHVRVSISDTGCGIAPDQLSRIFEPFVQADRERDALQGGLGLGLAIVRNLVQRHGGTIVVRSEGRGRGATFTVDLPVVAQPKFAEPPRRSASTARAGVRVMIVDDNVDVAELLSEALQMEGFQTAVAHDGGDALDRWRTFLPHAGVLDIGLPDVDGYQLARTLREQHGSQATLIAATGYGQAADRARATSAGFNFHLVKPVSVEQLLAVLDELSAPASPGPE